MLYFKKKLEQRQQAQGQREDTALQGMGQGGFKEASASGGAGGSFAEQRDGAGGFAKQAKGFGRTQQGDDPNRMIMRDEYGWKMTGRQYEALEKDRGKFESELRNYRTKANQQINQFKTATESQIAKEQERYGQQKTLLDQQAKQGQSELDKARSELGRLPSLADTERKWFQKDKMAVTVWDGQNRQGTYWVPRSMVKELNKKVEGTWLDKGKTYGVNVRQQGRMRGQEMHDMLRNDMSREKIRDAFYTNKEVQGEYAKGVEQWKRANSQLQNAQKTLNARLNEQRSALHQFNTNLQLSRNKLQTNIKKAQIDRDTQIGRAQSARQGQIDAAREGYEKRTALRRKAYQNLGRTSGYNKGTTNE